jgi:hypothetical protein
MDARSTSSRLINSGRKAAAWTLSRDFWQQKNFRPHGLPALSSLAKTGFSPNRRHRFGDAIFSHRAVLRRLW